MLKAHTHDYWNTIIQRESETIVYLYTYKQVLYKFCVGNRSTYFIWNFSFSNDKKPKYAQNVTSLLTFLFFVMREFPINFDQLIWRSRYCTTPPKCLRYNII